MTTESFIHLWFLLSLSQVKVLVPELQEKEVGLVRHEMTVSLVRGAAQTNLVPTFRPLRMLESKMAVALISQVPFPANRTLRL